MLERVSFRDANGRLHRWFAEIDTARDGRLIVSRRCSDGRSYGSTTRKPGQYFVSAESIIRRAPHATATDEKLNRGER